MSRGTPPSELRLALLEHRGAITAIVVLSSVLNVLLLGGSIYMMLVYDSVLPSESLPTLAGLFLMILAVFGFQGVFDIIRGRLLADLAAAFEQRVGPRVQQLVFESARRGQSEDASAMTPLRDLDAIRTFMASPGPPAFIDLPSIFLFLAILAILHPWLMIAALCGALLMIGLTLLTQKLTAEPAEATMRQQGRRSALADEARRHTETIVALGMERRLRDRWKAASLEHGATHDRLSRRSVTLTGISRVFRMFLQSVVLTVGAVLVIDGKASAGVIFASSIMAARALAPIDQLIANWRGFATARVGWRRLAGLMGVIPPDHRRADILPPPTRELGVEGLIVAPPGAQRATARQVAFRLVAGDAMGIIGLSGSGKSSLARALVGAWPVAHGSVRLDGADLNQFDGEVLGRAVGYLPQDVELLNGSVAENIARFDPAADPKTIVAAARAAGVHDLIVSLPQGYETQVGADGGHLSAGQRQRIGLARALFGDPFLVVLDEPNSNLDALGEGALDAAIKGVKDRGGIAIIVAHRPAAISRCNYLCHMKDGAMAAFGPKDEVLARVTLQSPRVAAAPDRTASDQAPAQAEEQAAA